MAWAIFAIFDIFTSSSNIHIVPPSLDLLGHIWALNSGGHSHYCLQLSILFPGEGKVLEQFSGESLCNLALIQYP